MSKESVNKVSAELFKNERGRFVVSISQSRDSGRAVMAGSYCSFETEAEAIEDATRALKRYLTPREYEAEILDLGLVTN